MINRGPDSGKVLKTIKKMNENYSKNVKVIMGNHEEMMIWYVAGESDMWLQHGGLESIKSFSEVFGENSAELQKHIKWVMNLPITEEDEDSIYCHAGIDIRYNLLEQPRRVLWTTKGELFSYTVDELLNYTNERKIYHGHSPVHHVQTDMARVSCDLGMSVFESTYAGLALVDITNQSYYRYSEKTKTISHKKIQLL